jgi:hypothetical protein
LLFLEKIVAHSRLNSNRTTNLHEAFRDALDYLEDSKLVNFKDFDQDNDGYIDSITFLHSGYGAEWNSRDCEGRNRKDRIWSHKWVLWSDRSGAYRGPWESKDKVKVWDYHISPALWGICDSEIGRVGVIAHETGHFLGLPVRMSLAKQLELYLLCIVFFRHSLIIYFCFQDLYDSNGGGRGLGKFCMMASSWGWDGEQYYPGHMSAWAKMMMGWLKPKTPVYGVNLITNVEEESSENQLYMIGEEFGFPSGEYLLIENRQKKGLDSLLPQGGLAIYHIDGNAGFDDEGYPGQIDDEGTPKEKKWPENGRHYRVALLQADGNYNLERGNNKGGSLDLFHADEVNQILPSVDSEGPFPNTDSYKKGNLLHTGIEIYDISASGDIMSFAFTDPNARVILDPPTRSPSQEPTPVPSAVPSREPSRSPSKSPEASTDSSTQPSHLRPSSMPSRGPTGTPSVSMEPSASLPSSHPSLGPSGAPSSEPSSLPSGRPSLRPSFAPSFRPTSWSSAPSVMPSALPSLSPSSNPTDQPTDAPRVCAAKNKPCDRNADCCKNKCKKSTCKK